MLQGGEGVGLRERRGIRMKEMKLWKTTLLAALVTIILTSCNFLSEERVKLRDLDFTVLAEEKIPEELKSIIEEKKAEPFQLTYTDRDYLYIVIGYGEQVTGGYSIAVNELYLTDSAVYVNTELLGPEPSQKSNAEPSFPYIVIKTEFTEQPVIFE